MAITLKILHDCLSINLLQFLLLLFLLLLLPSVQATQMWEPRFVGAPYELWVGSDATVGTSVGQVRVVDMEGSELMFDMFHSYQDGGEVNGR